MSAILSQKRKEKSKRIHISYKKMAKASITIVVRKQEKVERIHISYKKMAKADYLFISAIVLLLELGL